MSTPIETFKEKLYLFHQKLKNGLFEFLFRPPSENLVSKIGNNLVLCITYLAGVFHWAWLINYGKIDFKFLDWQKFFDY